jgi:putative flippase GtrA
MAANLAGFLSAFVVSLTGHGYVTFRTGRPTLGQARRFLITSLLSLGLSSAIVALADRIGVPFALSLALASVMVPALTFVASKFWVFEDIKQGPGRSGS